MAKARLSIRMRIGIPVGILLVLSIVFYGTYKYVRTQHRKHYIPMATQEISDGIYVIKDDYVNSWFLKTDCGLVAMDTAMNADTMRREMSKLNLDPADVNVVFLSHSDAEHAGELKIFPNATVYMAKEEVQIVDGSTYRIPILLMKNKVNVPYKTLEDGQVMDVCGMKIRCILTPGHTLGSMSYVVNDTILFGGDTLNLKDGKVVILDKGFVNMDIEQMEQSITNISKLTGIKTIFTVHFRFADFNDAFSNWEK